MSIRDHLCRVAAEVTDRSLAEIRTKEQWLAERPKRYRQYLEMMGLPEFPPKEERTPLNVTVTKTTERDAYTILNLSYESLPKVYVGANLYLPKGQSGPAPAVVYVCGHSPTMRVHYQPHPRRWAELGFVTIILDTIQFGEIKGYHHGCYRYGWFHWYSRGYTPGGVELWNAVRAVDLLEEREEVDPGRIGITGISGGGATSYWAAAADERFRVAAPVCGTGTVRAHVRDRTWDGHCDCMMFINTYRQDLADCGALIAPRPLLIASADRDGIYSIASIRETYGKIKRIYDLLGAGEDCRLIETPGGHSYHRTSRTGIFSFFLKHLVGQEVPPEEITDVDPYPEEEEGDFGGNGRSRNEPAEVLRVFVDGIPADERTTAVQETFVPIAEPPRIGSTRDVERERSRLVALLRERTFGHFPDPPPALDPETHFEYMNGSTRLARMAFTSEEDWRLIATVRRPPRSQEMDAPAILYLTHPKDGRWASGELLSGFDGRWVQVTIQCRGTGEHGWPDELQWHIRRNAAITGRTIASMQVWDALRAIEFVRGLDGIDGKRIALAGRGQMAVVALYAALLDGNVEAVALQDPPATQNAPSNPDGSGEAIEMLNVLRFTDLPQVAALLHPTDLVFIGPRPESYTWAEEVYAKLGGRVARVKRLADYRPKA